MTCFLWGEPSVETGGAGNGASANGGKEVEGLILGTSRSATREAAGSLGLSRRGRFGTNPRSALGGNSAIGLIAGEEGA